MILYTVAYLFLIYEEKNNFMYNRIFSSLVEKTNLNFLSISTILNVEYFYWKEKYWIKIKYSIEI